MCCVCLPGYHHALTVIGIIISAAAHELSDVTHYMDDMQLDQQAYTMHGVSSDEHVVLDFLTATGQLRLVHTLATGCGMLHRFRRRSVTLHIRMRER